MQRTRLYFAASTHTPLGRVADPVVSQPEQHVRVAGRPRLAPAREILAAQFFEVVEHPLFSVCDSSRHALDREPCLERSDREDLRPLRCDLERVSPLGRPRDDYGVRRQFRSSLSRELDSMRAGEQGAADNRLGHRGSDTGFLRRASQVVRWLLAYRRRYQGFTLGLLIRGITSPADWPLVLVVVIPADDHPSVLLQELAAAGTVLDVFHVRRPNHRMQRTGSSLGS